MSTNQESRCKHRKIAEASLFAIKPKENLKLGIVQLSSTDIEEENLLQVDRFLKEASSSNVDIVLLPENVLCHGTHDEIRSIARKESDWVEFLKPFSLKHNLTIVWGGIPVIGNDNSSHLFNASIVIDRDGELIANYAKKHLFSLRGITSEEQLYTPGDENISFNLYGWEIALSICFDLRFSDCFNPISGPTSGLNGPPYGSASNRPDLFICTAAFTQKTGEAHWEILCRARAIENQSYFAAANQYTEKGSSFATFGNSMIVDPWGIATKIDKPQSDILIATLNKNELEKIRKKIPMKMG
jgi:deaminated glutathione amidase